MQQGLTDLSLKQVEDLRVELPSLSSEGAGIFISNKEGLHEKSKWIGLTKFP